MFLLLRFIGATGCTGPVGGIAISIEQNIPMWWAYSLASTKLFNVITLLCISELPLQAGSYVIALIIAVTIHSTFEPHPFKVQRYIALKAVTRLKHMTGFKQVYSHICIKPGYSAVANKQAVVLVKFTVCLNSANYTNKVNTLNHI